jgi:site-specific DNA recombinase
MQKRAYIYIRVSTDEQADKGYSLAHQQERLIAYCDLQKIKVVDIFREDHSAKTFERPAFKKLLASLKQKKGMVDLLIFTKWDRFSRNAGDAYGMINQLNKLGVEPQAIEQPLDLSIPENKIMLAFYLAAPEVENDRRALNVTVGMRRAKKEGRWMATAPKGYRNSRSSDNRKIIEPSEDAPIVRWIFEELEKGIHTVVDVYRMAKEKGFKCSLNNFWVMLRNPVYCGIIRIPAYKDEPAREVRGLHFPIISESTFYSVQDFLEGRKRAVPSKHTSKDELPLRGYLYCSKCGRKLTGSASTGGSGLKHYYYHCTKGCTERIKAEDANKFFGVLLNRLKLDSYTSVALKAVIKRIFKENEVQKSFRAKRLKNDIDKLRQRITNAQHLMLDGEMTMLEYREMKTTVEMQIDKLEREYIQLPNAETDYQQYVDFGLNIFENLPYFWQNGNVVTKQRLVGSLFPEKLIFSKSEVRTKKVNEALLYISPQIRDLAANKNGIESEFCFQSHVVIPLGFEPRTPTLKV